MSKELTTIDPGLGFDEWQLLWFQRCRDLGHELKADDDLDGYVDRFVMSGSYCNGPGCIKCGWSACMHCDYKGERIPACISTTPT